MIEVMNALLALPGALVALDDLSDRISGSEQLDSERRAELEQLRKKIAELRTYLKLFAEFGPEMQAWKDAHHVTNLIIAECEDTFRLLDRGRSAFQQLDNKNWNRVRLELNTMRKARVGSITYISAHPNPKILDHVVNPSSYTSTLRWDAYILELEKTCRKCLDRGNRDDLFDSLVEIRNFVTNLNYLADQKLKTGLDELTSGIIEFRKALAEQDEVSNHAD